MAVAFLSAHSAHRMAVWRVKRGYLDLRWAVAGWRTAVIGMPRRNRP
jgi:hypothetical protein